MSTPASPRGKRRPPRNAVNRTRPIGSSPLMARIDPWDDAVMIGMDEADGLVASFPNWRRPVN